MSFCDKVRGLQPSPEALMEQLAAFPGDGGFEDFFARRDILMSAMGVQSHQDSRRHTSLEIATRRAQPAGISCPC
jgi:hypothetical protein